MAGNALLLKVSLLPLGIRNPLHVSLRVDMNTILKTRAFDHLRTDLDSSKETTVEPVS